MGLIWPNKRLFCDKWLKKKNSLKIATRTNFLLGLFTTFKVIETVIFKKNVHQEFYKNGGDSWFDTFMQKILNFLGRPPFE